VGCAEGPLPASGTAVADLSDPVVLAEPAGDPGAPSRDRRRSHRFCAARPQQPHMCRLHDRRRAARELSRHVPMIAKPAGLDEDADLVGLVIIAAVAALVSMLATGFMVGVRNDLYYLPIVRALYNEPQFAA